MQAYLAAVRETISTDRFESYRRSGDRDDLDVLARYVWNGLLCEALYVPMHTFEVALRNSLYRAVASLYPATRSDCVDVVSWLDFRRPILHANDLHRVPDAKRELQRRGKELTVGRLIAELNLNFWRKLLHRPYGDRSSAARGVFWPRLVPVAFPGVDRRYNNISRISAVVDELHETRNRMFHQEPIFEGARDRHDKLVRVIGWIAPHLEATVREFDRFPAVYSLKPGGLRERLEQIARAWEGVGAPPLGHTGIATIPPLPGR